MEVRKLKVQAGNAVDSVTEELVDLSQRIQSHPETAYEEFQAASWITDVLERHGFEVQRGLAGVETAFVARLAGKIVGPRVALVAEYDALAGVGHGCGHNLIAAGAVGAALGLKALIPGCRADFPP